MTNHRIAATAVCASALTLSLNSVGYAQQFESQLHRYRIKSALTRAGYATSGATSRRVSAPAGIIVGPRVIAVAQILPRPDQAPRPSADAENPNPVAGRTAQPRRAIQEYVDFSFGFDRQTRLFDTAGGAVGVDARRQISVVGYSAQYPISNTTSITASVPYVYQTARSKVIGGGSFQQRGQGVGDIVLIVERNFAEVARGTSASIGLGMQFPTGKDPFNLPANRLPTGVGFYQPRARLSVRKLQVPLQLYASVDYGTSFARRIGGQKTKLAPTVNGEVGFYYTIGPEFTTRTGISVGKISSPFVGPSASVGYLSQALIYRSGPQTSVTASVDVGLTDDSTDATFGLSASRVF